MKLKRKKIARNFIVTLLLILLMGCSVAFGVGYNKQITAYFYNIQVKLNGNSLNFSNEPFIYEGSVYIPLRDVSENLGLEVVWDGATKTVYLANSSTTTNYNYDNPYVFTSSVESVEDDLNDDFEKYTKGDDDLKFKYSLDEKSNYIKVEMEGKNFERDSSDWEKRDDKDFRDFIEDIAKKVSYEINDKDVKIDVEDEKGKDTAEYEYDESKKDLEVKEEYGEDDDDDESIGDIEDDLKADYDEYTKGKDDLKFDYSLDEKSNYIKVEMEGKNFKRDSSDWEKRDDKDFQDFIEDIAKKVCKEIDDKDVKIDVEDEDGKDTAEYEYDESKEKLEVKEEHGEDDNDDESIGDIEDDLKADYDEYTKGKDDLKFDYSLDEKSNYIKVEMEGKNFKRDSSDWEKRDDKDFRDFIEDIAKKVCKEIDNKDVKIDVEDEDGKDTAEYEYDESKEKLEVKEEHGEDDEQSIGDIEDKLKEKYDEYKKGKDDLEFKYSLDEKSNYIKVKMEGKNFKRDSSDWEKRDDKDFRDFIEDIAKEVCKGIENKDVKIYVDDKDGKDTARYKYDESKKDLEVEDEHND